MKQKSGRKKDEAAFDEVTHALVIKDIPGIMELMLQDRAFAVPAGTKVMVIDSGFTKRKVRILEGDMIYRSGWVPSEWVFTSVPGD